MPTFKLDDVEIPFEPGDTIIRAAHRVGVDIPHYCWHPGLSVAANCRMCLVELLPPPGRKALMLDVLRWDAEKRDYVPEKKPKLVPACQQAAAEGIEVRSTSSEHVGQARSAVQELLLLNHPVDCPICDQAGECRLQDYWLEHQGTAKRMRDEPVHKPKAVVFGPTIVYDAERCIVCTRCVRFTDEIAKDPVLDVRERGNLNEITVAPGRQLDHGYTLMTEHVCPVGALTSRDFRFKARVWFLRSKPGVCQGCATGCNTWIDYDPRDGVVHRHRPRDNEAVNKYWMCDEGMLDYARAHEGRVVEARVGAKPATLDEALVAAGARMKGVAADRCAVVLAATHSQEDNFALADLARHLGINGVYVSGRTPGQADGILRHADRNPNAAGVAALAPGVKPFSALSDAIESGKVTHVLALGADLAASDDAGCLETLGTLVVVAAHEGPLTRHASVLLPAASWAEAAGTFVNAGGLAQLSEKAISPQGDSAPAWRLIASLARELNVALGWRKFADLQRVLNPEPPAATTEAGAHP